MKKFKRILSILSLGLLTVLIFTACARNNNSSQSGSSSKSTTTKTSKNSSNKNTRTLIVYFSLTGTTKDAAQYIKKETGADIIRLRPEKAYGDYDSAARRGDRERRNNIHPALATNIPNFSKYQTVLIGYPTWWQRPPMIIHTLFDKYDFSGKTVVPFTTSMSTPIGPSQKVIRQLAEKDGATFKNGIRYDNNRSEVRSWLRNLGLLAK
ncbi:flavodoxin [Lactobacillus johnsonii]|uniref:flavodoxin n=1 Tax=Lactobacillus johnsonii TaxID=33959 RepID=UPI0028EEF6D6|nr:flavodoxin [Lactobacillus johnsonii]MDT9605538.1 flavodoxin [Lactobacillus johnsonii]